MQIPIGQNHKRGRPTATQPAWETQPDEQKSFSSDESSTDSTSELLKRIDLNDNAENTLNDASTLNETTNPGPNINTERNEVAVAMVVPSSVSGCTIRGARGGARCGARGGVETEISS